MTAAPAMFKVSARCDDCGVDWRGWIMGRDGTPAGELVQVFAAGWAVTHKDHHQIVLASPAAEDEPAAERPELPGTAYMVVTSGTGQLIFQRVLPELGDLSGPTELAAAVDRYLEPMRLVILDGETHEPRPPVFGLVCQLRPVHRAPSTP